MNGGTVNVFDSGYRRRSRTSTIYHSSLILHTSKVVSCNRPVLKLAAFVSDIHESVVIRNLPNHDAASLPGTSIIRSLLIPKILWRSHRKMRRPIRQIQPGHQGRLHHSRKPPLPPSLALHNLPQDIRPGSRSPPRRRSARDRPESTHIILNGTLPVPLRIIWASPSRALERCPAAAMT